MQLQDFAGYAGLGDRRSHPPHDVGLPVKSAGGITRSEQQLGPSLPPIGAGDGLNLRTLKGNLYILAWLFYSLSLFFVVSVGWAR